MADLLHFHGSVFYSKTSARTVTLHGFQRPDSLSDPIDVELSIDARGLVLQAPFLTSQAWKGTTVEWDLRMSKQSGTWQSAGVKAFRHTPNGSSVLPGWSSIAVRECLSLHHTSFLLTCRNVAGPTSWIDPSALCDSFTPHDLVFIFPNETGTQKCLWAKQEYIAKASPYWDKLFRSGYSECHQYLQSLSIWKELLAKDLSMVTDAGTTIPRNIEQGRGASTDASDEAGPAKRKKVETSSSSAEAGLDDGIRYIIIQDEPLLTYRAILMWIHTRDIAFSGLDDIGEPSCLATSSQAVYTLTHRLEIQELQKKALEHYTKTLSDQNAMKELLSTHSLLYPELKNAAMAAVVANWPSIKAKNDHLHYQTLVDAGEGDPALLAEVMANLLARV